MNTRLSKLATAVLVAGQFLCGRAVAAQPSKAPQKLIREWTGALEKGDIKQLVALYAKDAIAVESTGKTYTGQLSLKTMYEQAYREVEFIDARVEVSQAKLGDKMGFCYFKFSGLTKLRATGALWSLTTQATWVLVRTAKGWRIAHEHFSPIFGVKRAKLLTTHLKPSDASCQKLVGETCAHFGEASYQCKRMRARLKSRGAAMDPRECEAGLELLRQ